MSTRDINRAIARAERLIRTTYANLEAERSALQYYVRCLKAEREAHEKTCEAWRGFMRAGGTPEVSL
jgi:predicted transcriptional regulator